MHRCRECVCDTSSSTNTNTHRFWIYFDLLVLYRVVGQQQHEHHSSHPREKNCLYTCAFAISEINVFSAHSAPPTYYNHHALILRCRALAHVTLSCAAAARWWVKDPHICAFRWCYAFAICAHTFHVKIINVILMH